LIGERMSEIRTRMDEFFRDGWNEVNTGIETKKLKASLREDHWMEEQKGDDFEYQQNVKHQLAGHLFEELKDTGYIQFKKRKDPGFEQYTEYQATLNIADISFSNVVVAQNQFYFNDRVWTEKEICEALIQTYAHEMI